MAGSCECALSSSGYLRESGEEYSIRGASFLLLHTSVTDTTEQHRDLHWGNVLVRPTEKDVLAELANLTLTPRKPTRKLTGALESSQSGVEVTLIDFTLSRANLEERVVFDPFVDECIFDGEGLSCSHISDGWMLTILVRRG